MNPLRRLAGQTAIYGLSSIIGRLMNYLLVPLYTRVLITSDYGVYTEMLAWVSILWVLLTYGMETTFFRFSESKHDKEKVFSTALISLIFSSLVFLVLVLFNAGAIASWLGYPDNVNYVFYFGFTLAFDALAAIPFARLRQQNRPLKFAAIKLINIGLNISLNLFFVLLCPYLLTNHPDSGLSILISQFFDPSDLVEYIFVSFLIASTATLILLIPEFKIKKYSFDTAIWKSMMAYTWPLMIVAIAGSINLSLDKILLSMLLPGNSEAWIMSQVGIYGACYKVSIIMTLFVQTFRYAADPFFFAESGKSDSRDIYAQVLKYFTIAASLIFLITTLYMDVVIKFIGESYREGQGVIPILLLGNLFLGIFYNLSFWYKITNRTIYGAILSVIGAILTIVLNVLLIPKFGYFGSAWTAFVVYFTMMTLSYLLGRKYFPVPYDLKKFVLYLGLAVVLYLSSTFLNLESGIVKYMVHTLMIISYMLVIYVLEKNSLSTLLKK